MENREIGGKVYIRLLIYFCFLLLLPLTIFSRPIRPPYTHGSQESNSGALARVTRPPRPKEALRPLESGIHITIYQVVSGKQESRLIETRRHRHQAADAGCCVCILWKITQATTDTRIGDHGVSVAGGFHMAPPMVRNPLI